MNQKIKTEAVDGLYHEIFNEPERNDVFTYALSFVETRLKTLGYVIQ